MALQAIVKPHCDLPVMITVSGLIGNIVVALRRSGNELEVKRFIADMKYSQNGMDFDTVLRMAEKYVDFNE